MHRRWYLRHRYLLLLVAIQTAVPVQASPVAAATSVSTRGRRTAIDFTGANVVRWVLAALMLTTIGGLIVLAEKRRSRRLS